MTRRLTISALALTLLAPIPMAEAQGVLVQEGFVRGNRYNQFSETEKHAYLMGIVDGVKISPLVGLSRDTTGLTWFDRCKAYQNSGQLQGIVDRYFHEHPEEWQDGMGVIFVRAMKHVCSDSVGSSNREPRPSTQKVLTTTLGGFQGGGSLNRAFKDTAKGYNENELR